MPYTTNAGWDATYPPDDDVIDECIAREEDARGEYRRHRCTCGWEAAHLAYLEDPQSFGDNFPHDAFPGCRGCDPVDYELKPYRFGIELFEDESRLAAVRGTFAPCQTGWLSESMRDRIVAAATTISRRRLRHSDMVWDKLCNECETHREAVKRYKAWVKRSLATKYRDER